MRIISGKYRGKILTAPKNLPSRPTTDMAKESLFNILNNYFHLHAVKVLDLFAGTGNISFEFGSRGAEDVTVVDENRDCVKYIRKIAKEMAFHDFKIFQSDAILFLKQAYQKFNIIFADPPFDFEGVSQIPEIVFDRELLEDGGMLVLEHSRDHDFSEHPNFYLHRKYGSVHFSFFIPLSQS